MRNITENNIRTVLKKMIGNNCEPTAELEKMLLDAYSKGRSDALSALGIEESEMPQDDELIAWTA